MHVGGVGQFTACFHKFNLVSYESPGWELTVVPILQIGNRGSEVKQVAHFHREEAELPTPHQAGTYAQPSTPAWLHGPVPQITV